MYGDHLSVVTQIPASNVGGNTNEASRHLGSPSLLLPRPQCHQRARESERYTQQKTHTSFLSCFSRTAFRPNAAQLSRQAHQPNAVPRMDRRPTPREACLPFWDVSQETYPGPLTATHILDIRGRHCGKNVTEQHSKA